MRPHVTLKLATSLDGRIATASGESRWITGEDARAEVQRMRAAADAVMIGAGTARADDPELLARTDPAPQRQPLRVVLDTRFSLQPRGRLFASLDRAALLVIGASYREHAHRAALEAAGARTAIVAADGRGGVDVAAALALLSAEGVGRVLAEGGGQLAASLLGAGAVDRLEWFRAPIVLGAEGRPAVAAMALGRLAEAPKWRRIALRELGPDVWESYEQAPEEDSVFTGIVTAMGEVRAVERRDGLVRLTIGAPYAADRIDIGASIAHDGCCLTVVEKAADPAGARYVVEVAPESLALTTLGSLNIGDQVNLERSLRVGDELGGHWVLGHVDGLGEVLSVKQDGEGWRLRIKPPHAIGHLIAPKGSVAVAGVSLTVNEVDEQGFGVLIIPHTWAATTLSRLKAGDRVNLEADMMARYAARLIEARRNS